MKGSSSEEEYILIQKCRVRSRVDIINEEVKGCTSSSKQQEDPPEPTKTKEEIRIEQMKINVEIAALKWEYFLLQEQLKSLMYVYCSLYGDPKRGKFIDELKFKNCMKFKINTTSKFFAVIIIKGRKFIIHA